MQLIETQQVLSDFLIGKIQSDDTAERGAAILSLNKLATSLRGAASAADRSLLLQVYDNAKEPPPGWLLAASIADGIDVASMSGIPIESWLTLLDYLPGECACLKIMALVWYPDQVSMRWLPTAGCTAFVS